MASRTTISRNQVLDRSSGCGGICHRVLGSTGYLQAQLLQGSAISCVLMRQRLPLYRWVAGIEPNNLPQSDPGLVQRLWRNLPSGSGIARVSIKTTLTSLSDFLSLDATEISFIPLRRWHREQQSPAIRFRIRAVVVEESAIEFWDRQAIYKDNSHKGQRFHDL